MYETPNFLFLGDNTTSASAAVELAWVGLVRPPRLRSPQAGVIEWTGLPGQPYTVERSEDLRTWNFVERLVAESEWVRFTHAPAAAAESFFRVSTP